MRQIYTYLDNFSKNFTSMFNMHHRIKIIWILFQIDHLLIFLTGSAFTEFCLVDVC